MTAKKQTPEGAATAAETPEATTDVETPEAATVVKTPEAAVDVVAIPSLRADGTPDQTAGYIALVADVEDRDA